MAVDQAIRTYGRYRSRSSKLAVNDRPSQAVVVELARGGPRGPQTVGPAMFDHYASSLDCVSAAVVTGTSSRVERRDRRLRSCRPGRLGTTLSPVTNLVRRWRSLLTRRRSGSFAPSRSTSPRTLVGQWLRAGVLRQNDIRRDLRDRLKTSGWHDAESVAKAAFEIAIREAYSPGHTPVPLEEMVAGMRSFFGADGVDRIPQAEAELLIKAGLGQNVSTSPVPAGLAFMIHGLIFVGLAMDLQYNESKVDAVIRQAEDIAAQRGYRPTEP